ncbi:hypothetical protein KM043_004109 [Ampulex compressa]|nr:hypothetical protein KM043_004109 [Ampulex compressa]
MYAVPRTFSAISYVKAVPKSRPRYCRRMENVLQICEDHGIKRVFAAVGGVLPPEKCANLGPLPGANYVTFGCGLWRREGVSPIGRAATSAGTALPTLRARALPLPPALPGSAESLVRLRGASRRRPSVQSLTAQWRDRSVLARSTAAVVSERWVGPKRWTVRYAGYEPLRAQSPPRSHSAQFLAAPLFLALERARAKPRLPPPTRRKREYVESKPRGGDVNVVHGPCRKKPGPDPARPARKTTASGLIPEIGFSSGRRYLGNVFGTNSAGRPLSVSTTLPFRNVRRQHQGILKV